MPIELTMLLWSVALLFVLIVIQSTVGVLAHGVSAMSGSRDSLPPPTRYQERMKRIVNNHVEGLALFTPVALIAAQQNISTGMTVLGAQLFFYSRVAHALVYLAGLPTIRPLFFVVGVVGTAMIFVALIQSGL